MAICADCDKTVEIDAHGKCKTCGSSSILIPQVSGFLALQRSDEISAQQVIEEANRVITRFHGEEVSYLNQLGVLLVSARNARLRGMRFGDYFEAVYQMWALSIDIEESEEGISHGSYQVKGD
jgi:hypothetical protein